MSYRISLFLLLLPLLILSSSFAAAASIDCDNGIVSTGDSAVDLLTKCGKPVWKDSHQEAIGERIGASEYQKTYITVEQWVYDFGPQQFMRIVTLRNGVIANIRTGQYGPQRDGNGSAPDCSDKIISTGDTAADVYMKCGEPFYRNSHQEEETERLDDGSFRKVLVTVEEWTYNFGPQRFLRIITLRNGRVVDVRTGGYGSR